MTDQNDQPNNKEEKKSLRSVYMDVMSDKDAIEMPEQLQNLLEKSSIEGPFKGLMKNVPVTEEKHTKKGVKLAFYEDPVNSSDYAGIFKTKRKLLPDHVIKLIRVQNHLIATIIRARGNVMAMHGHKRHDRFDEGFEVIIKPEFEQFIKEEQMPKIQERIEKFEKLLVNCGSVEGLKQDDKMSLSEFLYLQAGNGQSFGRFATEIIFEEIEQFGQKRRVFHSFRPVDVGTIFNTVRKGEYGADAIRESSVKRLKETAGIDIDPALLESDEYTHIQAVNGIPIQAFTSEELIVYNLFPSTDIEHAGYPVTPIDTCLSSVTTHLSIDNYNRLYFQNGRAAKGILVIKSDEIDQSTLQKIRQDFTASINNVSNAFRAPVFGVNQADEVNWLPMTSSAGDGEFQFLYDSVARNILSTFNMSPDELPGYGHLSRGTAQQTLSESNNEFKLTAARDVGLRPMLLKFQSFFNEKLFPIIDPELAQICYIEFAGLDAQSREQESLRLQQDAPLHMTYDEILTDVDKDPIGDRLGGKFPFNERYQVIADKLLTVAEQKEGFLDDPSAAMDPLLKFQRDPFWLNHLQFLAQVNPTIVQAYYANRPYSFDILKMLVQDHLEEE